MCSPIADVESLTDRRVPPYIQPLKPGLFLACELGFSVFQNREDYSEDSDQVKNKQAKKTSVPQNTLFFLLSFLVRRRNVDL